MASHDLVLGHLVSQNGIQVDKVKIDMIQNMPYPTCLKDVSARWLLSMLDLFNNKFVTMSLRLYSETMLCNKT